jgi:hypothetical protein
MKPIQKDQMHGLRDIFVYTKVHFRNEVRLLLRSIRSSSASEGSRQLRMGNAITRVRAFRVHSIATACLGSAFLRTAHRNDRNVPLAPTESWGDRGQNRLHDVRIIRNTELIWDG